MDQAKMQLVPVIIFMVVMFLLPDTPNYWTNKNDKQVNDVTATILNKKNYIFDKLNELLASNQIIPLLQRKQTYVEYA